MSRRIDIELTSSRDDGSWTWRAAGAREPKGTIDGGILPADASTGQVLRVEVEGHLDGIEVVSVLPPKTPRSGPERLELRSTATEQPLVTSTLAPRRSGERGRGRNERGRPERGRDGGDTRTRERRGERGERSDRGPDRGDRRHDRPSRPAPPPVDEKPKPKRLRPGKTHRSGLLESVPAEQRPIAEQLLAGGIPAVRQAIEKQNAELKAEGKSEVKPDALLRVAEDLRSRAAAAVWRDRAEAASAIVDELDLRDLRSVVNAAGDAGRDDEAKSLAAQLREALANRVEKEHAAWLAELGDTVRAGRVVRALRLSSRPPKAGAPIPGDVATQLAEATAASLTAETGPDRWATVLDALAYSPVRRRVVPQSLPEKLSPDLRTTIARLASRLPEIAHIFDIEPDPAAERAARGARRRPAGGKPGAGERPRGGKGGSGDRQRKGKGGARGGSGPKDAKGDKSDKGGDETATRAGTATAPAAKAGATPQTPDAPAEMAATPTPEAPTTEAAGEAPATDTSTEAPTTEAPTEATATSETSATEAPATEAAATSEASTTEAPASEAESTSDASATDAPVTEATSETRSPEATTTEAPAADASATPATEAATTDAPAADASDAPATVVADQPTAAPAAEATSEAPASDASEVPATAAADRAAAETSAKAPTPDESTAPSTPEASSSDAPAADADGTTAAADDADASSSSSPASS